jgi:DNA-binding XRE family transcriptional regulator
MDSAHQRLQHARALAGYDGPAEAADALGVKRPTYYGHENGARGFLDDAERYAKFFRVSYEWLTTGKGEPRGAGGGLDDRLASLSPDGQRRILDFFDLVERADNPSDQHSQPGAVRRAR